MFAGLAIVPLIGIGLLGYAQATRAVAAQIEAQTRLLVDRSAFEIRRRASVIESDLLLLAENAETQNLLRLQPADRAQASASRAAQAYAQSVWPALASTYHSIELRDARNA